jgi:hypothetical protein
VSHSSTSNNQDEREDSDAQLHAVRVVAVKLEKGKGKREKGKGKGEKGKGKRERGKGKREKGKGKREKGKGKGEKGKGKREKGKGKRERGKGKITGIEPWHPHSTAGVSILSHDHRSEICAQKYRIFRARLAVAATSRRSCLVYHKVPKVILVPTF